MKRSDIEGKGVYVGLVTHALYTISYVSQEIVSNGKNKCAHGPP
jgi:hypothetical protein